MKKTILLMNTTLGVGGINASMINTANELSKNYDVSIFCYNPEGGLKERLNPDVHIIPSSWRLISLTLDVATAKKKGLKYLAYKAFAKIWSILFDNRLPVFIAISHQKHLGRFDVACSFTHEGDKHYECTGLIRVLVRKVDSPFKTSWVHCDYSKLPRTRFNEKYFNKVNRIVGVTDAVSKAYKDSNPYVKTEVCTCHNMLDYYRVQQLAQEPLENAYDEAAINCFSACRLSEVKGIPRAINAFKDVLKNNNVIWYIAGSGSEEPEIRRLIERLELERHVILLGERLNPFNYMKMADLYLSVSFEEAAPMVFMEAKALHVPIFATETLSVREMLTDGVDFVCENNESSMVALFDKITSDKRTLQTSKDRLRDYIGDNSAAISVFDSWMELATE